MELLSKSIEPTLKLLRQKGFYAEPRFHASIAWALLASASESLAAELKSPAATASLPIIIPSFPSSLLPNLINQFVQLLSDVKIGAFEVNCICVKIGKEVSTWPLGMK